MNSASPNLAPPFDLIFDNGEEANQGFEFLRRSLDLMNAQANNYRSCVLTLPKNHKGRLLRLNVGMWLCIDLFGPYKSRKKGVHLALLTEGMAAFQWRQVGTFSNRGHKREVGVFFVEYKDVLNMSAEFTQHYEESMRYIGKTFGSWVDSPFRHAHQEKVFDAIFDPAKRKHILHCDANSYTLVDCANETGLDAEELSEWIEAIDRKGQGILYGPPGTGKTFVAQRLARCLVGDGKGIVESLQFHPAYSYEEFIQGIRPQSDEKGQLSYPMVAGRFLEFCKRASQSSDISVLIIDEINRANLNRVFGELMFLLEYRDQSMPLAGGGSLQIPRQVRLIGTMNTADRSIALVDHAMRRRFAFLQLQPNYDVLLRYHEGSNFPIQKLKELLIRVNQRIGDSNYSLGISYFLHEELGKEFRAVWRMEIEPYLDEYFFDRPTLVDPFRWEAVHKELGIDK